MRSEPSGERAGVHLAALASVALTGHVLYPAALWALTRGRQAPALPAPVDWPAVTVVVPAYLESKVIGAKIRDVHRQLYPGPIEVVVVADDDKTYRAARGTGARVVYNRFRRGKSAAVNSGVAAATYGIIVLTDANALLQAGALERLVRHLCDPTVGAVAGSKQVLDAAGQGLYWRFESWLKRRESASGTTIGLVGELAAFRRSSFRPLPEPLVGDDLWLALDVVEAGLRVVYEPAAVALESGSPSLRVEWERRTRIVAGTVDILWRRRRLLLPRSGVAGQLWGHKLIRSTVGPLAHAILLGEALAHVRRSQLARVFVAGHVLGAAGLARVARGGTLPAVLQLPAQVMFLQGVALAGCARYLRGDRPGLWPKIDRHEPAVIYLDPVPPALRVPPAG